MSTISNNQRLAPLLCLGCLLLSGAGVGQPLSELSTAELVSRLDDETPTERLVDILDELEYRRATEAAGPLGRFYLTTDRLLAQTQRVLFGLGCAVALPELTESWAELDGTAQDRLLEIAQRADSSEARRLLLEMLRDGDERRRARAAYLLGELRYGAAHEALLTALEDPEPRVRRSAALALGLIGAGARELLAGVGMDAPTAEDLAGLDADRLDYLRAALRVPEPASDAVFVALLAEPGHLLVDELLELLRIRRPPGWEAALLQTAREYPPALLTAARLGVAAVIEAAPELLRRADYPTRIVWKALADLDRPLPGDYAERIVPYLAPGEEARGWAMRAALLLPRERHLPLLSAALGLGPDGDEPGGLDAAGLEILGLLNEPAAGRRLVEVATDATYPAELRATATASLRSYAADHAEPLVSLLQDAEVRVAAAAAWSLRGRSEATPRLRRIIDDDDSAWPLALAAVASSAYSGDDEAARTLRAVLESGDNVFSLAALGYLSELGLEDYLDGLAACLGGRSLTAGTGHPARRLLAEDESPTLAEPIARLCGKVLQHSEEPQAREDALWILETRNDPPARAVLRDYVSRP